MGGGIAGLTAALSLTDRDFEVVILEATDRLGGMVWTETEDGFVIEHGADAIVASRPEIRVLLDELGLSDKLVGQAQSQSYALRQGRLQKLKRAEAARLLGIEVSDSELSEGVAAPARGMVEIVDALKSRLADRALIRVSSTVSQIEPTDNGWQVRTEDGYELSTDAAVLAVPPLAAFDLVQPLSGPAAETLLQHTAHSSVSVSLAFPSDAIDHPPDASGFVVVDEALESKGLRACSFQSAKFPGRAPAGWSLLRVFLRPGSESMLAMKDNDLRNLAADLIRPILGITGQPMRGWVCRWRSALPRYGDRHSELVTAAQSFLSQLGPIQLAGAAYHGVGVAGAVKSGSLAARHILHFDATAQQTGTTQLE